MAQLCTFLGGVLINPCVTPKQRGVCGGDGSGKLLDKQLECSLKISVGSLLMFICF